MSEWKAEWQPIETAPKDGTLLLLYAYGYSLIGSWSRINKWRSHKWVERDTNDWVEPTHWMPLPDAPKSDK